MRITIREQNLARHFLLSLLILCSAAGALYFWLAQNHVRAVAALAIVAVIALVGIVNSNFRPFIVIDERGVFDRRLGVGTIAWRDIRSVQITGGYGNRLLSLRLRDPELYLQKSYGAKQKQYRKRQDLGFSGFKIDLRNVDLNLMDLMRIIEERIDRHSAARSAK